MQNSNLKNEISTNIVGLTLQLQEKTIQEKIQFRRIRSLSRKIESINRHRNLSTAKSSFKELSLNNTGLEANSKVFSGSRTEKLANDKKLDSLPKKEDIKVNGNSPIFSDEESKI